MGLVALSSLAAYADNVLITPVEGHQYKVVDGQLVDVTDAAPAPESTPVIVNDAFKGSAAPGVTVNIYNNQPQQPVQQTQA